MIIDYLGDRFISRHGTDFEMEELIYKGNNLQEFLAQIFKIDFLRKLVSN